MQNVEMIRYNSLTLIGAYGKSKDKHKFLCKCGNTKMIRFADVKNGGTKSCGCLRVNNNKSRQQYDIPKHEMPEHQSWRCMKQRCSNKNNKDFHHYGGRGITYADRWESFENFYEDMGERPEGMTLDRIDANGNYGPDNCKWSTYVEQVANRRCNYEPTEEDIALDALDYF